MLLSFKKENLYRLSAQYLVTQTTNLAIDKLRSYYYEKTACCQELYMYTVRIALLRVDILLSEIIISPLLFYMYSTAV